MARPSGSGKDTVATSVRLTRTAKETMEGLAAQAGLSQASMLEILIRQAARSGLPGVIDAPASNTSSEKHEVIDDATILRRLGLDDPEIREKLTRLDDADWQFAESSLVFLCQKHSDQASRTSARTQSVEPTDEKASSPEADR